MSQAAPESSSKGDLSMPYCDESDLVPSKTNLQLYWDCPPSPTGSERNVASNLTGSLKSLLSERFSRTFTALIVPRPRNQFQDGRSEDEEIEPLISWKANGSSWWCELRAFYLERQDSRIYINCLFVFTLGVARAGWIVSTYFANYRL